MHADAVWSFEFVHALDTSGAGRALEFVFIVQLRLRRVLPTPPPLHPRYRPIHTFTTSSWREPKARNRGFVIRLIAVLFLPRPRRRSVRGQWWIVPVIAYLFFQQPPRFSDLLLLLCRFVAIAQQRHIALSSRVPRLFLLAGYVRRSPAPAKYQRGFQKTYNILIMGRRPR